MTTIDPNSAQAALFEKLGLTNKATPKRRTVTRWGNLIFEVNDNAITKPDPFAPMDNGDFIAQMAQFSTVT